MDIELAKAARDAETAAGVVRAGDWLGLVEGEVIMVGDDPGRLAAKLVSERRADEHEILTLIVGADASDPEAAGLETALREAAPDLDLQVHRGGQPHYPYLIGLE